MSDPQNEGETLRFIDASRAMRTTPDTPNQVDVVDDPQGASEEPQLPVIVGGKQVGTGPWEHCPGCDKWRSLVELTQKPPQGEPE